MTAHKHLKRLVRARMEKTGERYAAARRQILAKLEPPGAEGPAPSHVPGNVPAVTALRILLSHTGSFDPATRRPWSEAMLFGLAGGLGAGVFAFRYEKEDFSSFFVAGRHLWQDDLAYLEGACKRLGVKPVVAEASSPASATKTLRDALAAGGPVIAWVDMGLLPHRGMPAWMAGMGYHVITVYSLDESRHTAFIGDLTDEPIEIPTDALAKARARIGKQKNRLLRLDGRPPKSSDLRAAVKDALAACRTGLTRGRMRNFTLEAFRDWAERMHGSASKESWERMFPPGHHLLGALRFAHDCIEHYGTGGGLCRPLFGEFLDQAGRAVDDARLRKASERYAELGRGWTALAEALLPNEVPLFRETKELLARRAELIASGGDPEEIRRVWGRLDELAASAKDGFPLGPAEAAEMRRELRGRIQALYEGEMAALAALPG